MKSRLVFPIQKRPIGFLITTKAQFLISSQVEHLMALIRRNE